MGERAVFGHDGEWVQWTGMTGSGREQQAGTAGGGQVVLLNYVFI